MTTVRFTSGHRWASWSEARGFEGDPGLLTVLTEIQDVEPPRGAPGFEVEPGTVEWAGAVIAMAARLLGLAGTFTWDPPLQPPRTIPGVIY